MFEKEIHNLIENIPKEERKQKIDIVCEGGAFNGYNQLGVMMYIKQLEKKNKIQVNRLSGSSVGSLISFCYLTDQLDIFFKLYTKVITSLKKSISFDFLKEEVKKLIHYTTEKKVLKKVNGRLYVNYYDLDKKVSIVKSVYSSLNELFQILWSSCYIPYISENKAFYKEKSEKENKESRKIDGGLPFIFKNRGKHSNEKIVYINLSNMDMIQKVFLLKKQKNCNGRILHGILEGHNFFCEKQQTPMISYVNNWGKKDYILQRTKEVILLLLVYMVDITNRYVTILHSNLQDYDIYKRFLNIMRYLYEDIFLECVFD